MSFTTLACDIARLRFGGAYGILTQLSSAKPSIPLESIALEVVPEFKGRLFVCPEFFALPGDLRKGAHLCFTPSCSEPFGYVDVEFGLLGDSAGSVARARSEDYRSRLVDIGVGACLSVCLCFRSGASSHCQQTAVAHRKSKMSLRRTSSSMRLLCVMCW